MLPDRPPPAPSDWPGWRRPSLHPPLAGERETRTHRLWPACKKTFRVDYNPMGALHTESRAKTTPRQKQNNSELKAEQHRKAKKTYGSGRSFFPGELSVLPPSWVLVTPVLESGVHPILNRLHQPLTVGQGHHGACQPLGRQAGDLVEEAIHLDHLLLSRQLLPARALLRCAAGTSGQTGS